MIQDPVAILAYLAAVVGVVFQLGRLEALRPVFDRVPPLVWAYFVPMLSTSVGLLPDQSVLYRALARHLLPASLALMLLSSDLRAIARLGRTALVAMAAGVAGVALGAVAAFALFRPWLPAEAWKAMGALTGTWTGGSANLLAVATTLGLSADLQGVIIVVDTIVGYTWMGLLISLATKQDRFDRWLAADTTRLRTVRERLGERATAARAPTVADLAVLVAIALVLTAVSLWAGGLLPPVGRVLNAFSWAIILLTTAGLVLSLTPVSRLEAVGASTLGYAGFYLLLASVGAQADLRKVASYPQFVLLGVVVIAVHAAVLFGAVRLMRAPLFFFAAASQACIGGYSSAPLVAALYQPAMAPVGLLLAVLGNVAGTYLGLLVAELLAGMGA